MASSGSWKYLYERLGDKRFQQLCGALVLDRFPDVSVFPVGEKDGGRDMVSGTGDHRTILQVKFSGDRRKKTATWMKQQINGEAANIKRLVDEGCTRYILMTNVEGGAAPGSGSRDEVERELTALSKKYKVPMSCVWASDLDAWVDNAPWEIKLAYVDMLAGTDALFALLTSLTLEDGEKRERDILVTYVGTHWARDRRVKFRQIDLVSDLLSDLFVEVSAHRSSAPRGTTIPLIDVERVAGHLLDKATPPLTLLEGVPGQGKSTLAQYVCQVYRATFIGRDELKASNEVLPETETDELRVPFRIDLADYAEWATGGDPFSITEPEAKTKPKARRRVRVEDFLLAHVEAAAPGHDLDASDIHSILDRFPTQIVFDGLDEVASAELRQGLVGEIEGFIGRWIQARPGNMRVLVTTRPNASGLAEPAPDLFQRLVLQPLTEGTRKRYLRRWVVAQQVDPAERKGLERIFGERTAAPHVAQLASNPMQLTILLHLIRTKGDSLPTARTSLYREYMNLFLAREAAKSRAVLDNLADLEEATAFIGWFMHALTEVDATSTRLSAARIVREMTMYLASVQKETDGVQGLFEALRDRVWVLTSKHTDTYEFDVQSIREFFAARFLYEFAQSDSGHGYEPENALVELLPRSYWSNAARFLAGHFQAREIAELADLIETRLGDVIGARQIRTTLWTLLADGIFKERPPAQSRVAKMLTDGLSVRFLAPELVHGFTLPTIPSDFGAQVLGEALRNVVTKDPTSPITRHRLTVAAAVSDHNELEVWWQSELGKTAGRPEETAWLVAGGSRRLAASLPATTVDALALKTPETAVAAIEAGVTPADGSPNAQLLLDAVLDGDCSDAIPHGTSEASDLLRVVAPRVLMMMTGRDQVGGNLNLGGHRAFAIREGERTAALKRLAERRGNRDIQEALRIHKNEGGTTTRWVNTARALTAAYGRPTWLATEIAAIAAALPEQKFLTGGNMTKGAPCFGTSMDYGQWLPAVRAHKSDRKWWTEQVESCDCEHAQATWVLGLLVAGNPAVVMALIPEIADIVDSLPERERAALLASSSRIAASGLPRTLGTPQLNDDASVELRLLLGHYSDDPTALFDDDLIIQASARGLGSWPAARAAGERFRIDPSLSTSRLVSAFGAGPTEVLPLEGDMPADVAQHILTNPTDFSLGWLIAADRALTSAAYSRPLKNHADVAWGI
ncbi:NACHT domain-containing protein [Nocardioides acrostichi]|uniref:ATP-binding protein n=1 Tax=Nocardioides acrostichi TaxID=2784339 RepID=A0A930V1S9_9ACTN|nr:ATP-binding protein [Nocardioides acrostichi]MBF4162316.1 ATP-binding protein [Nocardioides acrostichi]